MKTAAVTHPGCRFSENMRRMWVIAGHAGMRKVPKKALLVKIFIAVRSRAGILTVPTISSMKLSPFRCGRYGSR